MKNQANNLIHETSPYLLQHAYNPVEWYPWSNDALTKAKSENKLLVISIGYAACHWCHVMEHESFEDASVAELMNKFFISIKVDREERPDIDQIYMDSAYLLTGRGGWPLNVIALPDGRPFFAGTYFRKNDWLKILKYFAELYQSEPKTFFVDADKIVKALNSLKLPRTGSQAETIKKNDLSDSVKLILNYIDLEKGGTIGAPKFPMPNIYDFLLRYFYHTNEDKCLDAVEITLNNISSGGIYDHIGGGFARYSTDDKWKVPHFEKMLYDNAQLVSLYSNAYKVTKSDHYKKIVFETLEFIGRELADSSGGFYSSLDADSEGEEGKYYLWTKIEIDDLLGDKSEIFCDYYSVLDEGNWEGKNILYITQKKETILSKFNLSEIEFENIINNSNSILLKERAKRIRPGLDDKILTSWNALMLKGYVDAFAAFGELDFLKRAETNGKFIINKMMNEDGRLYRNYKNGKSTINAFLDDYSFTIEAFISLYESTFDEHWIYQAKKLLNYVIQHFYDSENGLFYYTSDIDDPLIMRKSDFSDNVTPSSNSSIAVGLIKLSKFFFNSGYEEIASRLLNNMKQMILKNPLYHSNWLFASLNSVYPAYEVAVVGDSVDTVKKLFLENYLPNIFLSGGGDSTTLELLKNKHVQAKTMIYICENGVCRLPVENFQDAIQQIKRQ